MLKRFLVAVLSLLLPTITSAQTPVTTPDSGAVAVTTTINSSSHAAGTALGGLIAVPIARIAGGAGIVTQVAWVSPGGSTGQIVVRIWQRKPASTTCTDNTAYAGNATDDQFLITPPFSLTPAAPAVTTGDAKTYASSTGLTLDFKNQDLAASTNLYVCVVTVGTDTADETSSPWIMLSGPLD